MRTPKAAGADDDDDLDLERGNCGACGDDECHGNGQCAPNKHAWQRGEARAFGRVAGRRFILALGKAWERWNQNAGLFDRRPRPDMVLVFPLVDGKEGKPASQFGQA